MPGRWAGSSRRDRLPPNWKAICAAIRQRDGGRCTWVEAGHRCRQAGTDVDHVVPGDDHRPENLRLLCPDHHKRKSSAEGNAARWRVRERRPREAHPGLLPKKT